MMTKPSKRHKFLNISEKLEVLDYLDTGVSLKEAAVKFGCSSTVVGKIRDDQEILRKLVKEHGTYITKRKRFKMPPYLELEKAVYNWYKEQEADGIQPTHHDIRSVALHFASSQNMQEFATGSKSNVWTHKFLQRYGILVNGCNKLDKVVVKSEPSGLPSSNSRCFKLSKIRDSPDSPNNSNIADECPGSPYSLPSTSPSIDQDSMSHISVTNNQSTPNTTKHFYCDDQQGEYMIEDDDTLGRVGDCDCRDDNDQTTALKSLSMKTHSDNKGLILYVRTGYNRRTAQTSCIQPTTTTQPDLEDITPQQREQNPIDAFADFVRAALKNMGSEQRHKATMKILQALNDAESGN